MQTSQQSNKKEWPCDAAPSVQTACGCCSAHSKKLGIRIKKRHQE